MLGLLAMILLGARLSAAFGDDGASSLSFRNFPGNRFNDANMDKDLFTSSKPHVVLMFWRPFLAELAMHFANL